MNSRFLRRWSLIVLLPFSALPLAAAAEPSATRDEQEILKIEHEACEAYLHGDADYLAKLLTDDFSAINGRAEANNKAEELAEVRGKAVHYVVFENHDQVVRLHGDTCVVTGRTTVKGTGSEGKEFAVEVKFTDVFTRIGNQWRMLAGHSSRIPEKQG